MIRYTAVGMLSSIEFHHQALFETAEVGDERADEELAAEFGAAKLSRTKPRPKLALRIGLISSQSASPRAKALRCSVALGYPHPRPLPAGEGILKTQSEIANQNQ